MINNAYAKLLPKVNQTTLIPEQFLCPYSNISACSSIEGQEKFTLTLWNPTIHPVTIYPRVPVTRQYTIRDPLGNFISAEVRDQRYTTKNKGDFSFFYFTVSSNSRHNEKCSRSNEFCSKSVYFSSITASTWLQHLLFRSHRYVYIFYFTMQFTLVSVADEEKIEHKKVVTTTNEACVLQNEVGHQFEMLDLLTSD